MSLNSKKTVAWEDIFFRGIYKANIGVSMRRPIVSSTQRGRMLSVSMVLLQSGSDILQSLSNQMQPSEVIHISCYVPLLVDTREKIISNSIVRTCTV